MSSYIEYNDKIAFHPGYYINEIVEESGLTQEDFAKRLDTTPKNISKLINGEQNLSRDMALKLSRMMGTSVEYWLNFQKKYDALLAEFDSDKELNEERAVFRLINYVYFKKYFGLPDLPRKVDEQIKAVREFLNVASLTVLKNRDLAVNFRRYSAEPSISNVINSNVMVQISINKAIQVDAPKFNKKKFSEAVDFALSLTDKHGEFFPLIKDAFYESGVIFVVLPNLDNSGINGATKKVGNNIMLMVNDRRAYSDTFWFTLFHEIGHIINGDYGITYENENEGKEDAADLYAQRTLIPQDKYEKFVEKDSFTEKSIREFADVISRDPGIVLGRLQNDGYVSYKNARLSGALRHKYQVHVK
ncbi:MAG: HigA family addiction module antidote protein [Lachnospiraceae bacterium]|nr:HigA family addiction module antidote protein [Lachnospiraceae bacterium]